MAVSAVVAYLAVPSEVSPQECHWHRGVHGRPGLWHLKKFHHFRRSRRGRNRHVSPPIVRYARAGDCNVLVVLGILGTECRLLPNVHAHRTLDNWYGSSARQDVSCVPLETDPVTFVLAIAFAFDLSLALLLLLLLLLPLPLYRCHATIATASNCRALPTRRPPLGLRNPSYPAKRRDPSHGFRRLPSSSCSPS